MGWDWSEDDLGKKDTMDDTENGHVDASANEEPDDAVTIDSVDTNDGEKEDFLRLVVFPQNFVTFIFVTVYSNICIQYINTSKGL